MKYESNQAGKLELFGKSIQLDSGYYIPINPDILADFDQAMQSDDIDLLKLAEIVAQDVGLSAIILKTINSPHFGFNRQITDIKQSIMLLGHNFLRQLSNLVFIRQTVPDESTISLERFWDSSTRLAYLTSELIEYMDMKSDILFEDAYTAGLFVDSGIPIMALRYKDYLSTLQAANNTAGVMFTKTEDKELKSNHAVVGYYVAKSWDLPDIISDVILGHHDEEFIHSNKNSMRHKDLFGILKLAENILHKIRYGSAMHEWEIIKESILDHFHLGEYDCIELEQDMLEKFSIEYG